LILVNNKYQLFSGAENGLEQVASGQRAIAPH
jgi:hypothetical protein